MVDDFVVNTGFDIVTNNELRIKKLYQSNELIRTFVNIRMPFARRFI